MSSKSTIINMVEQATSEALLMPDWETNLRICDAITAQPELAPPGVKALRKRIAVKNDKVSTLALTLLDALVKTEAFAVHREVAHKDCMAALVGVGTKGHHVRIGTHDTGAI